MDVFTKEQRSLYMARVKGRDTKPEMIVRQLVHSMGYRYRLHRKDLPGKPDLVFASRKKVIFVHGCYWHRHDCPAGRSFPASNADYWSTKLKHNRERDQSNCRKLVASGWSILIIWECETRSTPLLIDKVKAFLEN